MSTVRYTEEGFLSIFLALFAVLVFFAGLVAFSVVVTSCIISEERVV
jgi:hypothetical protein